MEGAAGRGSSIKGDASEDLEDGWFVSILRDIPNYDLTTKELI